MPISGLYWRYHPVRRTFEAYASGTSNSWGFDYNESGDWFSETCVIPHFWHIIQGAYCVRQSNPPGHFNPCVYTNIETIADHLHYTGNTPHSGNNVRDARSSLHHRLISGSPPGKSSHHEATTFFCDRTIRPPAFCD